MPIESAQYIDTLQPDWPQGVDPEADGDDHIRMVKQVLKNQFPNLNAAVNGTPEQINQITQSVRYDVATTDPIVPSVYRFYTDSSHSEQAAIAIANPTLEQLKVSTNLAITWQLIIDLIYPIGSVVIYADNVNPATRLGFGTWTQRSGVIYGAGSNIEDAFGALKSISLGGHKSDAAWRVQNGHLVTQTLDVEITMDPVEDHSHHVTIYYLNTSAQKNYVGAGTNGTSSGTQDTQPAGGHTPTGKGSVVFGAGTVTSGDQFMNPGWAFTVWERTA